MAQRLGIQIEGMSDDEINHAIKARVEEDNATPAAADVNARAP